MKRFIFLFLLFLEINNFAFAKIILLTGSSSSGKSSIIKEILTIDKRPWLTFGIDLIAHHSLSSEYMYGTIEENVDKCFMISKDKNGIVNDVKVGKICHRVTNDFIQAIESANKNGADVLIDECILDIEMFNLYFNKFKNRKDFYIIGLTCEDEELKRREIVRKDRAIGAAVSESKIIKNMKKQYNHYRYDVELNTTNKSPTELAKEVLDFIK